MEMTFWPRAVSSPTSREFQRDAASDLLGRLRTLVADVRAAGRLDSDLTDADVAELLIAVIDGLSVHAELFPKRLPAAYQKKLMRAQLEALGFRVDEKAVGAAR